MPFNIVLGKPVILRGLKNYGAGWNTISMSFKDTFIYNVPIHQNAEFIQGIQGSAFVFDLGTLCIAHLGDLSQKLNEQQIKVLRQGGCRAHAHRRQAHHGSGSCQRSPGPAQTEDRDSDASSR